MLSFYLFRHYGRDQKPSNGATASGGSSSVRLQHKQNSVECPLVSVKTNIVRSVSQEPEPANHKKGKCKEAACFRG